MAYKKEDKKAEKGKKPNPFAKMAAKSKADAKGGKKPNPFAKAVGGKKVDTAKKFLGVK